MHEQISDFRTDHVFGDNSGVRATNPQKARGLSDSVAFEVLWIITGFVADDLKVFGQ